MLSLTPLVRAAAVALCGGALLASPGVAAAKPAKSCPAAASKAHGQKAKRCKAKKGKPAPVVAAPVSALEDVGTDPGTLITDPGTTVPDPGTQVDPPTEVTPPAPVLNPAKQCKAERADAGFAAAHGGADFAHFYGTNRNLANAFGKCVSGRARERGEDDGPSAEDGDDD